MSSGAHRATSTGTGQPLQPRCRTLRSRNTTATARSWNGWSGSATINTSDKSGLLVKGEKFLMDISFENKVALVSGAASCMGLAIAMAFVLAVADCALVN